MGERLAFLGIGVMGAPMTRNLLKAGYPVTVWNRTREKGEALRAEMAGESAPVTVADTPAEAARAADVVLACLFDAEAVEAVVTGPDGIAGDTGGGIAAGGVFIDLTTNSPPVSRRLAERLAQRGAAMLDAPVSGGDVGAIQGTLSIMAGGDPEVFRRCRPILETLGRRVTLMGHTVGAGGYAKLANQIMVAIHLAAMGEALAFGAKAGLELDSLVRALGGGLAASAVLELKAEKVLSGDFTPGGEARLHLKDLTYVHQAMEALGISLPLAETLRAMFADLVNSGHGHEDHSAIVRLAERAAGVEARR